MTTDNTITLTVSRPDIFAEVDKTSDYTGAKLIGADPAARDRIVATETDLRALSRFWDETCAAVGERLKEMFLSASEDPGGDYSVSLRVSVAFDRQLIPAIEATLRSYFITSITAKWYVFAKKDEAEAYFNQAAALMEDIRRKLYSRRMIRSPRHALRP